MPIPDKEQTKAEASFKSIKDDSFELDSVFLKTPERIGVLMMIMVLMQTAAHCVPSE